jgi:DNA-binding PadR family transcriptional regulator
MIYIVLNIYFITNKYKKAFFLGCRMTKEDKKPEKESENLELKGFLSFLILHDLCVKNLCGDELSKSIGKRKNGPLTPGTIYPALKRLRRKKFIAYRRQGRKKVYSLTDNGRKELDKLYGLFSIYFHGLKNKIVRNPPKKKDSRKRK